MMQYKYCIDVHHIQPIIIAIMRIKEKKTAQNSFFFK